MSSSKESKEHQTTMPHDKIRKSKLPTRKTWFEMHPDSNTAPTLSSRNSGTSIPGFHWWTTQLDAISILLSMWISFPFSTKAKLLLSLPNHLLQIPEKILPYSIDICNTWQGKSFHLRPLTFGVVTSGLHRSVVYQLWTENYLSCSFSRGHMIACLVKS